MEELELGIETMVDNKRWEGSDQVEQADERGITPDSPGLRIKATGKGATRRLKQAKKEREERQRGGRRLQCKEFRA